MGWEVDLERDESGGEGRLWGETGRRGELQSGYNIREKRGEPYSFISEKT